MSVFYRDIDVKISDYKSELSKPLVIFERDRGLEIYFNLVEYAYRLDKNPKNLLENLVGAYATVTLVNPDGYEISVDEVEITEDAKVKFVITEDLTDELTEIGTYQLQIHVNNDTEGRDTSVFSIPPFNFEVRERLKGKKNELLDSEGNGLTDEGGYQLVSATTNRVINFPANKINEYLSSIPTIQNGIKDLNSQLETIVQQIELYKNKQTINFSKFQQELFYKNHDTSIACVGDSLTYGLDEVSSDRRVSTADITDMGVSTNPISRNTYPEILRACLWEVYGKNFTVKKMAVGGDTLTAALNRWKTNPEVKVAIMMFGTNDSYREENTEAFIRNYFELIKRFLNWGSAVVLMTPPKKYEYSEIQDIHAEVVKSLGKMLSIPVIDTREIFDGYPLDDLTTDYVHFTPDMYYLLGTKITNLFVLKRNLIDPFKIDSEKHLYVDIQNNNCFVPDNGRQEFINNCSYSPMDIGKTAENGKSIKLYENGKIYFSFYSDKDVVLIPLFRTTSNGKCVIDVNFRMKQPCKKYDFINEEIGANFVPLHQKNYNVNESRENLKISMSDLSSNILITSKGINTACVKNGATGVVEFFGFYVLNLVDYYNMKEKPTTLIVGEDITYETDFSNIPGLKTKIIKKDGFVDIQFAVKVAATGFKTIFTLPEGFRPEVTSSFVLKNYGAGEYDQVYIEDWTGVVKNQSTNLTDIAGYIRFKCK